jgi:hypothetical protein
MLRYLTIHKNPILLQLVDIPKCHLEVDAMTFKILTDDTLKVIHQSNVRLALNLHTKNLRLDQLEPGDVATAIVKSHHDSADDGEILPPMPVIDPLELIGRTFLMDKEDGQ